MSDILSRNKLPIVVGGTGFYLRMFIFGKSSGGAATPEEAAEARRLVAVSVATRAVAEGVSAGVLADVSTGAQAEDVATGATEGVATGGLDEGAAWEAGVQVLRDLGDAAATDRYACASVSNSQLEASHYSLPRSINQQHMISLIALSRSKTCNVSDSTNALRHAIHSAGSWTSATTGTASTAQSKYCCARSARWRTARWRWRRRGASCVTTSGHFS